MVKTGSNIRAKLPSKQEALAVFSVILFVVFSWTLYRTAWWAPSWLEYLSVWGVLIITAYALAFALFESLALMGVMCVLSLILPRQTFKDLFILQGSTLALILGGGAFLVQRNVNVIYQLELEQTLLVPALIVAGIVVLALILRVVFQKIQILSRLILMMADRMTIFAYLYVPLGLIGLVVVIARNLW